MITLRSGPDQVIDLYKRMSDGGNAIKAPVSSLMGGVSENFRNVSCASVAGKLFYDGCSMEEVLELCIDWNMKKLTSIGRERNYSNGGKYCQARGQTTGKNRNDVGLCGAGP